MSNKVDLGRVKGDSAFEVWQLQEGNQEKTYEDFELYNRGEGISNVESINYTYDSTTKENTNTVRMTFDKGTQVEIPLKLTSIQGQKGEQGVDGLNNFELYKKETGNDDLTFDEYVEIMKQDYSYYETEFETITEGYDLAAGATQMATVLPNINLAEYGSFIAYTTVEAHNSLSFALDARGDRFDIRNNSTTTVATGCCIKGKRLFGIEGRDLKSQWLLDNAGKTEEDFYNYMKQPYSTYETEYVQISENVASMAANASSYPALKDGVNLAEYGDLIIKVSEGLTGSNPVVCYPMFNSAGVLGIRSTSTATNVSIWAKKNYGVENKTMKQEYLDDNAGSTDEDFYKAIGKELAVYESPYVRISEYVALSALGDSATPTILEGINLNEYNSFIGGADSKEGGSGSSYVTLYRTNVGDMGLRKIVDQNIAAVAIFAKKNYGVATGMVSQEDYDKLLARVEALEGGN